MNGHEFTFKISRGSFPGKAGLEGDYYKKNRYLKYLTEEVKPNVQTQMLSARERLTILLVFIPLASVSIAIH